MPHNRGQHTKFEHMKPLRSRVKQFHYNLPVVPQAYAGPPFHPLLLWVSDLTCRASYSYSLGYSPMQYGSCLNLFRGELSWVHRMSIGRKWPGSFLNFKLHTIVMSWQLPLSQATLAHRMAFQANENGISCLATQVTPESYQTISPPVNSLGLRQDRQDSDHVSHPKHKL